MWSHFQPITATWPCNQKANNCHKLLISTTTIGYLASPCTPETTAYTFHILATDHISLGSTKILTRNIMKSECLVCYLEPQLHCPVSKKQHAQQQPSWISIRPSFNATTCISASNKRKRSLASGKALRTESWANAGLSAPLSCVPMEAAGFW